MTILHAGGKFGKGGYKVSGGLHGVGISVVNALSEWMITRVKRDGKLYEMKFERGITVQKLKKISRTDGHRHDPVVQARYRRCSKTLDFHWDILQKRLRELAFLNRGLSITLRDERGEELRERERTSSTAASSRSSSGSTKRKIRCIRSSRRTRSATASTSKLRCSTPTRTPSRSSRTPTTSTRSKAACICKASAAVTQRRQRLRAQARHAQGSRRLAVDRRHHGRPHRGRLGEAARSAVRRPDQDEARQRKGAQHRLRARQRTARFLLRRESEARARHRREVHAGAARARSREESARSLAPQERARRLGTCRANWSTARTPIRRRAKSSWSKAIRPAAPPRADAIRTRKRSCRCAARSSTSRRRVWTRCSRTKRFAR